MLVFLTEFTGFIKESERESEGGQKQAGAAGAAEAQRE